MTTSPVILFDLGKVLVDFDWRIAARKIAVNANATPSDLLNMLSTTDWMLRFERGEMTGAEFFNAVRQRIGYRASMQEFQKAFCSKFSVISEMVQLHTRVRESGISTWAFSNTNEWAVTHIRAEYPFFSGFDGHFLSYQLGVMKPDAGIYEAAERRTGCHGAAILYIDDLAENIHAAAARGWLTIQHSTPAQTVREVDRLLFR